MPVQMIGVGLAGMSDQDSLLIPEAKSPDMLNVRLFQQKITARPGTLNFEIGDRPTGKNLIQVGFGTGNPGSQFLLLDANTLSVYDSAVNMWQTFTVPVGEEDGGLSVFERMGVANTLGKVVFGSVTTRLRVWDGVVLNSLPHDLPGELRALVLLAFNNRVVAVRPSVGGVDEPVTIRWCANGDLSLWSPANDGAGLLLDVETSEAPITGGFVLGNRAYITKKNEISELVATGNLDEVFKLEPRIVGKGMIAPFSWAASDYFGFFLGNDNVYMWDGSNLIPVGDDIKTTIFEQVNSTSQNQFGGGLQWIQGLVNARRHEYWLYIPFGPGRGSQIWIYNWKDKQWYQDQYPMNRLQGMGIFSPSDLLTPSILQGTEFDFDAVVLNISEADDEITGTRRICLFDNTRLDRGLAFMKYVTTKDYLARQFTPQGTEPRLGIYNILKSTVIQSSEDERLQISMSPDKGKNWVSKWVQVGSKNQAFGWFNKAFSTCRFRILHSGDGPFEVEPGLQYNWKPGGVLLPR